jgi:hypothetical protein
MIVGMPESCPCWCDPGDHLVQGHALWHVLSALSLLAAYFHDRRLGPALART